MTGEQRMAVRDAEIAVQQIGAGTDLVLVHGFQNDHTAWDPFVERLDLDRFRVTTFDLVGCGTSGGAATWQRCTIEEYAADLVAICDRLGLAAPFAVGHSLGGATVLQAALTWPHRLRALVLVAPASTSGLDFVPDDATFEVLAHPTPEQQRELALAAFRRPPSEADLDAVLAVIARATPQHIEGAARSMRAFERQGHLGALALPVLLACGDRDRHVPLRNHLVTQQAIPRCGLQVWTDVGHVPFVEVADDFAAVVGRFLAGLG
jgi:pimeloyl-ACP methyl ester carboxylesterase